MTGKEKDDLAELKTWLFGEDGQGGYIGAIHKDMKALRTDMDFLKGAVKLGAFLVSVLGLGGMGYIITAAVANAGR